MKKILLFWVSILIFNACGDDNSTTPSPSRSSKNEIVPLSIGNYWKYKVTDLVDITNPEYFTYSSIISDTLINDSLFLVKSYQHENYLFKTFCYNDKYGYFEKQITGASNYIMYPAKIGDEFLFNELFSKPVKVKSTNFKLKIQMGTFDCYHFQSQDSVSRTTENGEVIGKYLLQVDMYYSVGIGLVYSTEQFLSNEKEFPISKNELVEYYVK